MTLAEPELLESEVTESKNINKQHDIKKVKNSESLTKKYERELGWYETGHSSLSGDLLELYHKLDHIFKSMIHDYLAEDILFPPTMPAAELNKVGYFKSFPHIANFLTSVKPDLLDEFSKSKALGDDGFMNLPELAGTDQVLTPAACYHIYIHNQDRDYEKTHFYTTKCTCFRCEEYYKPLYRQRSFSMRERVAIGGHDDVNQFLDKFREAVPLFSRSIGIDINLDKATDPFFDPKTDPKFLMQKLEPVKHEMVFANELAIGSINFHRNYFGEKFNMTHGGEAAFSGCVAFGLHRWIYAFTTVHGYDKKHWPSLNDYL